MTDHADARSFHFREATVADRDAVLALRRRCFPAQDPEKLDPRFWEWQFSNSPSGSGMTFVAVLNGRAVAHFALIPQTYVVDGSPVSAAMAIDAMTDPEVRGSGVYTRLHAFALAHAPGVRFGVAYQIRRPALAPLLRNGWAPRFKLPVLVRPVSLTKLVRRADPDAQNGTAVDWSDEELAAVASEFFSAGNVVHQHRSPRYFSWRYRENPLWKYDVRVRRSEGVVLAYLITRRTHLKGFSTLAVLDVAWRRGHRGDARAILRDALRDAPAQLAAALVSASHPAFSFLLTAGFLPGPHRFRFLLRDLDPAVQSQLRASRWALMWGDTDHL